MSEYDMRNLSPLALCEYKEGCTERPIDGSRYCSAHAAIGIAQENNEAKTPRLFAQWIERNHEGMTYQEFLKLPRLAQTEITRSYAKWLDVQYAEDDPPGCVPVLILLSFGMLIGFSLFGKM